MMNAMAARIALMALGLAMVLLPFERLTGFGLGRGSWNAWEIFFGVVFCGVWVYVLRLRQRLSRPALMAATGVSMVLAVAALVSLSPGASLPELLRLVGVIWTVPLIVLVRDSLGRRRLLALLMLVTGMHAVWGISQFVAQGDLGWQWLGETKLDVRVPGVAKFAVPAAHAERSTKLLRAYGPFPHANAYGGTLVLGVIAAMGLWRLRQQWHTAWLVVMVSLLAIGILASFSRSALIGMLLLVLFFVSQNRVNTDLPRRLLGILAVVFLMFAPFLGARLVDREDAAATERYLGAAWGVEILRALPAWQGVGGGQYAAHLRETLEEAGTAYEPWQLAPVHAVPLLLATEWGLATAVALLGTGLWWWLRSGWQAVVFGAITPLLLLDHYLLTQTGPLLALLTLLVALAPAQKPAAVPA